MSAKKNPLNDAALSDNLAQWRVDEPLPPGFQENVWRRISRVESRTAQGAWPGLRTLIGTILPRPKFAAAFLVVVLAVGVAGGSLAAQYKNRRLTDELSARYVQSIDPFRLAASFEP